MDTRCVDVMTAKNKCIPPRYQKSLEKVRETMSEDSDDAITILKILSDPVRLHILKALEIEDLCVCVLVEITGCSYSALSYHLKLLKDVGLITSTRDGNFLIYGLTDKGKGILRCVHRYFE